MSGVTNKPMDPESIVDPTKEKLVKTPSPAQLLKNTITLADCTNKFPGREIYVVNNSKAVLGATTKVVVNITSADGEDILVEIPSTWIPVKLTDYASAADICKSTKVRASLNKESIVIINPDYAEALLETPTARNEATSITRTTSLSTYGELLGGKTYDKNEKKQTYPEPKVTVNETEDVRPELVAAVMMGIADRIVSALTLAEVSGDLTRKEAAYVRLKCTEPTVIETLDRIQITA